MAKRDDEFLKRLLAAFKIEAEEHIRAIANGLLDLEKTDSPSLRKKLVETMYREAHSLKGAARSVNKSDVESVCQAVESVFSALKKERIEISTELFDTLHHSTDVMTELLSEARGVGIQEVIGHLSRLESTVSGTGWQSHEEKLDLSKTGAGSRSTDEVPGSTQTEEISTEPVTVEPTAEVPVRLQNSEISRSGDRSPEAAAAQAQSAAAAGTPLGLESIKEHLLQSDTVRISVDKLDPLLRQVGEMVSVKLTTGQRVEDIMAILAVIGQWKQRWTSLSTHGRNAQNLLNKKLDFSEPAKAETQFARIMDFLDWNQTCIQTLEDRLKALVRQAENDARAHGGMVDDLLEDMMNVLMLPCSSLLEIFPKLVRDLARDRGKQVNLHIKGGDLEIDRRILEEMKDPLMHLVRNCIDHGIEKPEDRARSGKNPEGTVTISLSQISGNQVELIVADDGAGIDVVKVREAASRRGMLSDQDKHRLDPQDAVSLVFRSEVSTSPIVTNISGRGLGLAIVREKAEKLGGNISVATAPQMGASFRILLPVTLSTFRGILVRASNELFVIPTANVERVARIRKDSIKTVGNRDTIEVNGRAVPLVKLGDVLEIPRVEKRNGDSGFVPVLILSAAETKVAFSVDGILQEQEVLVKGLGKQLSRVRNVAGATVLGSGKLCPILNVPDLIASAHRSTFSSVEGALKVDQIEAGPKSILVVEDSITSRMLLKNILESSGYEVTTAVDGADAWTALKTREFDLVVSDIEMPKIDGFDLTVNIRNDESLSSLPVVLVTSLGSREDRERGIDVGANAYIVKGSFDQNNLLETVQRLI